MRETENVAEDVGGERGGEGACIRAREVGELAEREREDERESEERGRRLNGPVLTKR